MNNTIANPLIPLITGINLFIIHLTSTITTFVHYKLLAVIHKCHFLGKCIGQQKCSCCCWISRKLTYFFKVSKGLSHWVYLFHCEFFILKNTCTELQFSYRTFATRTLSMRDSRQQQFRALIKTRVLQGIHV